MQKETEQKQDQREREKKLFDSAIGDALSGYAKDGGDWEKAKWVFEDAIEKGMRVDGALYVALDDIREGHEGTPEEAARRFWEKFPLDKAIGSALTGYAKDGGSWELAKWTFNNALEEKTAFLDVALDKALDAAHVGAETTKEVAARKFWRELHPSFVEADMAEADLGDGVELGELIHRPDWKGQAAGTFEGEKDGQPLIVKQGIDEEVGYERSILAAVDYPGIPKVLSYTQKSDALDGLSRLAMEKLPGRSLKDRVEVNDRWESKPIAPEAAVAITDGVAGCFDALNKAGYVYRDLTLDHVLVDEEGGKYKVGLIDVEASERKGADGVAEIANSDQKRGTWETMSPEEFGDNPKVDERSSVYSLSCLLNQLVAGESPFHVPYEVSDDVGARLRFTEFLHKRGPSVQTEGKLGEVIRTGLHPDPEKRYQTIRDFREALAAAL
ncbi:MAG TPA: lipopolysaccharide kinase InaA family protein [Candidatus Saccharimonadales bacterium]|nr:lipopolysaccharide kinase InaA family protein [Candidatus Saccharimonadales bacterium]